MTSVSASGGKLVRLVGAPLLIDKSGHQRKVWTTTRIRLSAANRTFETTVVKQSYVRRTNLNVDKHLNLNVFLALLDDLDAPVTAAFNAAVLLPYRAFVYEVPDAQHSVIYSRQYLPLLRDAPGAASSESSESPLGFRFVVAALRVACASARTYAEDGVISRSVAFALDDWHKANVVTAFGASVRVDIDSLSMTVFKTVATMRGTARTRRQLEGTQTTEYTILSQSVKLPLLGADNALSGALNHCVNSLTNISAADMKVHKLDFFASHLSLFLGNWAREKTMPTTVVEVDVFRDSCVEYLNGVREKN